MADDPKAARRHEIAAAAYAILEERGYAGTSMLAIARRARASNETLYAWYGDKRGLFAALVAANAAEARRVLEESLSQDVSFDATLHRFGTTLLRAVLGARAVALNRAAAAEPTGELAKVLAASGRDAIVPLLHAILARQVPAGMFATAQDMLETYLGLLIGDRQLRRVLGALPPPNEADCDAIAADAVRKLRRLMA